MNSLKKLGFGCVALTMQATQSRALRLLSCAYDHGIEFYDTAPIYAKGYSEILLGKFIYDKRDKVIVTTKFGLGSIPLPRLSPYYALPLNYLRKAIKSSNKNHRSDRFTYQSVPYRLITKDDVQRDFYLSLNRLKTTYIDNYLIHEATPSFLSEDAVEFLLLQKQNGIIRNLGLGVNNKNLEQILPNELNNWDILQYEYGHNVANEILYQKFPNKTHIYHSIIKSLPFLKSPNVKEEEALGYLFAQILSAAPNKRILFSSSSEKNIINNIKYTQLFYNKK